MLGTDCTANVGGKVILKSSLIVSKHGPSHKTRFNYRSPETLKLPFPGFEAFQRSIHFVTVSFFGGKKTVFVFVFQENPRKKIVFEVATISRA
jgi:hypothetical protein